MSTSKKPSESFTVMNEIVLPNDTNTLNNLMGGRLLHWMDIVVTASVDGVSFKEAIRLGDVVTLQAYVTRSFNSSMEVYIEVFAQNIPRNEQYKCNDAYYTFVAIDSRNRPIPVPTLEPETEAEKLKYEGALRRRQIRLVMAGKLDKDQATELKAYLNE